MFKEIVTKDKIYQHNNILSFWCYLDKVQTFINNISNSKDDKQYVVEVTEYKESRSLKANAYMWKLASMIGNKIGNTKEFVYFKALKDSATDKTFESGFMLKTAFERMQSRYKYIEIESEMIRNEKEWVEYKYYYGSSTFNSKEMYNLIMELRREGIEQGLDVRTPSEIQEMTSKYGKEFE